MANNTKKLGVIALASVVVSSMVGGGIYSLPQNMAAQASVGAVIIAWVVTGIGMFFLANSFRILSDIRPDLKAGIYMYGREGFGSFVGFLIAWGYWLCQIFGNVGYAVITMDALNYFFPPYFAGGNTIYAIIGGSILIWLFNFVVLRGTQQAAVINTIGTIGKLIPLFVFIIIMIFVFHIDKFDFDFFGKLAVDNGQHLGGLGAQIKSTMLVTLWAFIGIEGAVVLSDRAQSQDDVGKATIMGFVGCLIVYVLLSVLPFGFMTQQELAAVPTPSTAGVLERAVGTWGSWIMNIGLIIAVLASWLAWTLITAEMPFAAAKTEPFHASSLGKRQRCAFRVLVGDKRAHAARAPACLFFQQCLEYDAEHHGCHGFARLSHLHAFLVENVRGWPISPGGRNRTRFGAGLRLSRVGLWALAHLRCWSALFAYGIGVYRHRYPCLYLEPETTS